MKIGDVKNIKIAKKYANALILSAIEKNIEDKVYTDIVFVFETIKTNNELSSFLYNPVVTFNDKKEVITRLFSVHTDKISLDFILLLVEKGRLNVLEELISQYLELNNKHKNIIKPQIISAVELNQDQKEKVIHKLQMKLSKTIIPEYIIKPEIIGGLIVEIGDKTIDCSIQTKFENMKKRLTKGNSYGNN